MTSWIGFIWLRTGISGDVFCKRKSNDGKFLERLRFWNGTLHHRARKQAEVKWDWILRHMASSMSIPPASYNRQVWKFWQGKSIDMECPGNETGSLRCEADNYCPRWDAACWLHNRYLLPDFWFSARCSGLSSSQHNRNRVFWRLIAKFFNDKKHYTFRH